MQAGASLFNLLRIRQVSISEPKHRKSPIQARELLRDVGIWARYVSCITATQTPMEETRNSGLISAGRVVRLSK